jgi:hypothetical protein
MALDVNKIITESLNEANGRDLLTSTPEKEELTEGIPGITEKLEVMKGGYGNKIYDALHPEKKDTSFDAVKKISGKLREERDQVAKKTAQDTSLKAADEVEGKWKEEVANTDQSVVAAKKAAEKTAQVAKENEVVKDASLKTAKEDSFAGRLGSAARKIKKDAEEGVDTLGRKFTNRLHNLDYEKTGLLGAGALAAGLGALALRKRLKNANK